jgi:protein TonB
MIKLRSLVYRLRHPAFWSGRMPLYFLVSAGAHIAVLGVLVYAAGSRGARPDISPITVYIKPESITVDFEPERINPDQLFMQEPLKIEKFPEITVLGENEPVISRDNQASEPASADYSTQARPILDGSNKLPPYPRMARQLGQEGRVILSVEINAGGLVQSVTVLKSSGYKLLDDAAVKTVQGWIFIPAVRNGRPAASKLEIPVLFKLT